MPGRASREHLNSVATPASADEVAGEVNSGVDTDLRRVAESQQRLERAIASLDDAAMRRPSALAGWTVAHVLTHIARNADSHVRRAKGAARGEMVDQYVGGHEGRRHEIEEGAARSAIDVIDDVRQSGRSLQETWHSLPASVWDAVTCDLKGRARPLRDLPLRRWQELEVHLVDLSIGATYASWSEDFVRVCLPRLRATVPDRLAQGALASEIPVRLSPREELAWLYGRLSKPDLPELAPYD